MSLQESIKRTSDESVDAVVAKGLLERMSRLEEKVDALISAVAASGVDVNTKPREVAKGAPFWMFSRSERGLVVYASDGMSPWPNGAIAATAAMGSTEERFNSLERMIATSNAEIMVELTNMTRALGLNITTISPAAESVAPPADPTVGPWPIDPGIKDAPPSTKPDPDVPSVGPWPIDPGVKSEG